MTAVKATEYKYYGECEYSRKHHYWHNRIEVPSIEEGQLIDATFSANCKGKQIRSDTEDNFGCHVWR